MAEKVGVMIVCESAALRMAAADALSRDGAFDVVGAAPDPLCALVAMVRRWPDVVVLDVDRPRMEGVDFIRKLMTERPTAVVIWSTLDGRWAETALLGLVAGAAGVAARPPAGAARDLPDGGGELAREIKNAAKASVARLTPAAAPLAARAISAWPERDADQGDVAHSLVAIGASTGGVQAVEQVLAALPRHCPGIVVALRMSEKLTDAFANRLDRLSRVEVREARDGDRIAPGRALIAPGGRDIRLVENGAGWDVELVDATGAAHCAPSLDALFGSARLAGACAMGVLLSGTGGDGVAGLKQMRDAGACTVIQDERTCAAYETPGEAEKAGAVDRVLPIHDICAAILGAGRT